MSVGQNHRLPGCGFTGGVADTVTVVPGPAAGYQLPSTKIINVIVEESNHKSPGCGCTGAVLLIVTVFMSGFGVVGSQNGANAMAAEVYPTAARSTGVGWALGVGRIGSILGPNLGAHLVGTTPRLFLYAAVPLMLAATAALVASAVHKERQS